MMLPGTDPRIAALETELARTRAAFEATLAEIPAARLGTAPDGQWSPAQIVWHCAKVERGVARMIEKMDAAIPANATVPPGPGTSKVLQLLDRFEYSNRTRKIVAPEPIRPPAEVDLAAERARLSEGRAQLLAAIRAAGPRLSLMRQEHPVFKVNFDGWEWTLMIARHDERHRLQLREVAGLTD